MAHLRISDHAVRAAKLHAVKEIEGLHPQLKIEILVNGSVLIECEIVVCNAWSAQRGICSGFVTIHERVTGGGEAIRVEIIVRGADTSQAVEHGPPDYLAATLNHVRPLGATVGVGLNVIGRCREAQRVTLLECGNAVYTPTCSERVGDAGEIVEKRSAFSNRKFIDIADHKTLTRIEAG